MLFLTLRLLSLGCADRLSMIHSLQCYWGTAAIQDSFSLSPNNLNASAAVRRMLNPSCTCCCISLQMNAVISGVHAYAWGLFFIDFSRDRCAKAGPVCNGMPSYTYYFSRVVLQLSDCLCKRFQGTPLLGSNESCKGGGACVAPPHC